jgi:hypothetical protein
VRLAQDIEALVLGPEDVLVLKLPAYATDLQMTRAQEAASQVLGSRCLILAPDVEMATEPAAIMAE